MIQPSLLANRAADCIAVVLLALSSLHSTVLAHEGHDHGDAAKPAGVRLAPRFEMRSEDMEIVGVLADENLLIYVDRGSDNTPILDAQIEVEGPEINGFATAMADGVYQLPTAALARGGRYPLTLTIQAGSSVDLFAATLEVGEVPAAASAEENGGRRWWLAAGMVLLVFCSGLVVRRRRSPAREGATHHG